MTLAAGATPPDDPEALAWHHAQVGDLYLRLGKLREAETEYIAASHAFPGHPFAMMGYARLLAARGERSSALNLLQELARTAPTPDLAARTGDLLEQLGRHADAERQYALAEGGRRARASGRMCSSLSSLCASRCCARSPPARTRSARRRCRRRCTTARTRSTSSSIPTRCCRRWRRTASGCCRAISRAALAIGGSRRSRTCSWNGRPCRLTDGRSPPPSRICPPPRSTTSRKRRRRFVCEARSLVAPRRSASPTAWRSAPT